MTVFWFIPCLAMFVLALLCIGVRMALYLGVFRLLLILQQLLPFLVLSRSPLVMATLNGLCSCKVLGVKKLSVYSLLILLKTMEILPSLAMVSLGSPFKGGACLEPEGECANAF